MALVLPGLDQIAPNLKIKSSTWIAILQAISGKFSNAITGADIDPNAGIPGSAILARSITADRHVAGSLTQTELGLLCVGTPQLIALAVDKTKLATTPGSRVTKAQTEIQSFTGSLGWTIGGGNIGIAFTPEIGQQTVGGIASWVIRVRQTCKDISSGTIPALVNGQSNPPLATLAPVVAIPSATTTPLGIVLDTPSFVAGGGSVNATLYYINNT